MHRECGQQRKIVDKITADSVAYHDLTTLSTGEWVSYPLICG